MRRRSRRGRRDRGTRRQVPVKPRSHSSSQRGRRRRGGWSARRGAAPSAPPAATGQQRARLLAARQRAQRRAASRWSMPSAPPRLVERRLQRPPAERLEALLHVAVAQGSRSVGAGLAARAARRARPRARRTRRRSARRGSCARPAPPAAASPRARRRRATAPRSGRSTPASRRSSVDLPTPLGPTRPARSPSPSTNERPSKSGAPSWAFVRSDACNMESSCVVERAGGLGRGKRDGPVPACEDAGLPAAPPHARAREVVPRRPEIVCGGCLLHRGPA